MKQKHEYAEKNPEEVDNLRRDILGRDDVPKVLENDEILILRQSDDHRGVLNIFEPEFKMMLGMYFDSLLNFVYTFDT